MSHSPSPIGFNLIDFLSDLFPALTPDDTPSLVLALQQLYCVPRRSYHTWNHVWYMLETAHKHGIELRPAEVLAIVFHDIAYTVGFPHNEKESAELMLSIMTPLARDSATAHNALSQAADIINDTAFFFEPHRAHSYSGRVLDLDLASLGEANWARWIKDRRNIRAEFGSGPEDDARFFEALRIRRPRLFPHTHELECLEEVARSQINRFLDMDCSLDPIIPTDPITTHGIISNLTRNGLTITFSLIRGDDEPVRFIVFEDDMEVGKPDRLQCSFLGLEGAERSETEVWVRGRPRPVVGTYYLSEVRDRPFGDEEENGVQDSSSPARDSSQELDRCVVLCAYTTNAENNHTGYLRLGDPEVTDPFNPCAHPSVVPKPAGASVFSDHGAAANAMLQIRDHVHERWGCPGSVSNGVIMSMTVVRLKEAEAAEEHEK